MKKSLHTARKKNEIYATIDLGTNNCRLLIARPTPHSFMVMDAFSKITRLGEGLAENNVISQKAAAKTILALEKCATKLKKHKITKSRYIATATCRRALNGREFIKQVEQKTGIKLEIISEKEEARLGVVACVPLLNRRVSKTIVFDIGGGSTQISWANVNEQGKVKIEGFTSIPMGVVTVSEGFFGYEITPKDYKVIALRMMPLLEEFEKKHNIKNYIENNKVQMIGTSGTVTKIAAFHLNLQTYIKSAVDGMNLTFSDISKVQKKFEKMPVKERAHYPAVYERRSGLVMAGFAILDTLLNFWPVGELTVSDRGLREGVIMDLMQTDCERVKYE